MKHKVGNKMGQCGAKLSPRLIHLASLESRITNLDPIYLKEYDS